MTREVLRQAEAAKLAGRTAVCIIVRGEAREGEAERVEKLLRTYAYQVRNEELGCDAYTVTRLIGSEHHFAVHGRFINWDALKTHGETDHLHKLMEQMTPHLATPISIEIYVEV
jgi:quinol monooxygenase YgiN